MRNNLFDVSNKKVVITGGLGQLGSSYALAFLESGARVAILDSKIDQDTVGKIFGTWTGGPNLLIMECNILDRAALELSLKIIIDVYGIPDVLINNAAIDSPPDALASENGPFELYPETSFDNVMAVNVKGVYLVCQIIGGKMAEAGKGSIINISSIYGMVSPDQSLYEYRRTGGETFYKPVAYSVSKSAVLNLTRYLAVYWAGKGVRVNTLTLAGVFNYQNPEFLKAYCSRIPIGRMAEPSEYSGAVLFLSSNASGYMTGSNLIIDGGWTAI